MSARWVGVTRVLCTAVPEPTTGGGPPHDPGARAAWWVALPSPAEDLPPSHPEGGGVAAAPDSQGRHLPRGLPPGLPPPEKGSRQVYAVEKQVSFPTKGQGEQGWVSP